MNVYLTPEECQNGFVAAQEAADREATALFQALVMHAEERMPLLTTEETIAALNDDPVGDANVHTLTMQCPSLSMVDRISTFVRAHNVRPNAIDKERTRREERTARRTRALERLQQTEPADGTDTPDPDS